jgi:hypothetical protein
MTPAMEARIGMMTIPAIDATSEMMASVLVFGPVG